MKNCAICGHVALLQKANGEVEEIKPMLIWPNNKS